MPSLRTLDRRFRPTAEAFFKWARSMSSGPLVVTSARRSRREQARLYQAYLRGQNNGLPATPPGFSSHERGLAWDMAHLNVDPFHDPELAYFGKAWQAWGGTWWAGDPVHFAASPALLDKSPTTHPSKRRGSHR